MYLLKFTIALFVLAPSITLWAQSSPFACTGNFGVDSPRAEGLAERLPELVLTCNGGTPTPANDLVPTADITVTLNATVTSRVTAVVGPRRFTETLLIVGVGIPNSPSNPDGRLLNCGNTGAPDSGPSGPGICAIRSTGGPETYDGSGNGYGSGGAVCDGLGGRPQPNAYGCGRPNVFQGVMGTPQDPSAQNAVTFFGVPVESGGIFGRSFMVTNLRANTSTAPINQYGSREIIGTVSTSGPASFATVLSNPSGGSADPRLLGDITCGIPGLSRIRICPGNNGFAWKPRNISFLMGDHAGIPSNATLAQFFGVYNGGTNYPADIAQNVPGYFYVKESGFQWQDNSTHGPPSPNPPAGFFTAGDKGLPLNSIGYGGVDTRIRSAGIADSGTRIALRFSNIPQGASVQVPGQVYLFSTTGTYNGNPTQFQSGATGVLVLTTTDSSGAGPFAKRGSALLTVSDNLAVYEVLWADPTTFSFTEVPYALMNAPPGTAVSAYVSYAPFYSDSPSGLASATGPVPRFSSLCAPTTCLTATPGQGTNLAPLQVSLSYNGPAADLTGAQVLLRTPGMPDIPGTNVSNPSANVLNATFDLTSAPPRPRDVVIIRQNGGPIVAPAALIVLAGPPCVTAVNPGSILVPSGGAGGTVNVMTNSGACNWAASTDTSWVALSAGSAGIGNGSFGYSVAASILPARLATISTGSQSIKIMQAGARQFSDFQDVPISDPYFDYISLMKDYGITAGCSANPPLFCPDTAVTRAQMAVFIVAGLNKALGTSLTYNPTPYFNDMQPVSGYFPFVQRIKDLGITAGCSVNPPLFCSDSTITQGQMAVFMIVGWMIANNLTDFTYSQTPYFTDVPANHPFFKFIQKMRDLGISTGCTATSYCESSPVTRGQMAPMIMRALLAAP